MRIYTKTGDRGETGLLGGVRVPKSHRRVEAYGAVDELNAFLGVVRASLDGEIGGLLAEIQRDLFTIGAHLADVRREGKRSTKEDLPEERIAHLEAVIDRYGETLPPLRTFILPGGTREGALLHLARTICRRAERRIVALDREERVSPVILAYMNRLSDLLFVLARAVNRQAGVEEIPW